MSSLVWKIREALRQFLPIVIAAFICYGGYTLYKKGAFRHGVGHFVSTSLKHVPYFGSRFRHYTSKSYAYGGKKHYGKKKHYGRKSKGRKARRHRR